MKRVTKAIIAATLALSFAAAPIVSPELFSPTSELIASAYEGGIGTTVTFVSNGCTFSVSLATSESGKILSSCLQSVNTTGTKIIIPASYSYNGQSYPLLSIAPWVAKDMTNITSISIPSSITEIGYRFASGCTNLTTVTYSGTNLEFLGYGVFYGSKFVQNFNSKNAVTLGEWLIRYNPNATATSVTVNNLSATSTKVKKVAGGAFENCKKLQTVNLSGITHLCSKSFKNATTITSFTNPSSLQVVESNAVADTAWYATELNKYTQGKSVVLGKFLLTYQPYDEGGNKIIDMSAQRFDNVRVIVDGALGSSPNYATKSVKKYVFPKNLEQWDELNKCTFGSTGSTQEIKYYNATSKKYVDLKTVILSNNLNSSDKQFINRFFAKIVSSMQPTEITGYRSDIVKHLAKKYIDDINVGLRKIGQSEINYNQNNSLNEWEQYQVIRNLAYGIRDIKKTQYKYKSDGGSVNFAEELMSPKGFVCHDFAQFYNYLLRIAGIESKCVSSGSYGGHEWNIVKIGTGSNAKWFNVDTTRSWSGMRRLFMTTDLTAGYGWDKVNDKKFEDKCHTRYGDSTNNSLYPACTTQVGDINGDKSIDSADAQLALKAGTNIFSGKQSGLTPFQMVMADVNVDGRIDSEDAQCILRYYTDCIVSKKHPGISFESYLDDCLYNPDDDRPRVDFPR